MTPTWLLVLAILSLALTFLSAGFILVDELTSDHPLMPVMKWVWPITTLYMSPAAVWAYWTMDRSVPMRHGSGGECARQQGQRQRQRQEEQQHTQADPKPESEVGSSLVLYDAVLQMRSGPAHRDLPEEAVPYLRLARLRPPDHRRLCQVRSRFGRAGRLSNRAPAYRHPATTA